MSTVIDLHARPVAEPVVAAARPPDGLPWPGIAAGVVLSVLLRLRMYWTPITSDEGGFLAIARAWAHGKVLQRDVWVDRPQGLLTIYRFWDWLSGGSVASLRIMAMLFGAVLVVVVGAVATQLAGRSAGAIASILVAGLSASPVIEGHLANGELLSGAIAVAGLAIGLRALDADRTWHLVAAGALAGVAISIKQSAFDGLLTLLVWVVLTQRPWRRCRSAVAALLGGAGTVLAALALHGAATSGFRAWWYAMVAQRFDERSAVNGAKWARLLATFTTARAVLLPLLLVCAIAWVARRERRHERGTPTIVGLWALAACTSFIAGGNFFLHYWVALCPVLSVATAIVLSRWLRPRTAMLAAIVLLLPGIQDAVTIFRLDRGHIAAVASDDLRPAIDEQMARWFRAARLPGDELYVLCSSPGFYADAGLDPPTPYIWRDHVLQVPGAREQIVAMLRADDRPRFVAEYQSAGDCDPAGGIAAALAAGYVRRTTVDGVPVLERAVSG